MFMLMQFARSLYVRNRAAASNKRAEAAERRLNAAECAVEACGKDVSTAKVRAEMELEAATNAYFAADDKRIKWTGKRDKAVNPTSRVPAYLAGKLDAGLVVAAYELVPQVAAVVTLAKGWLAM